MKHQSIDSFIGEDSISIIVPALNEGRNVCRTVEELVEAVEGDFADYEIIIIDDCSEDDTGQLADSLRERNPHIRVVHNKNRLGLGGNYRLGLSTARMNYVTLVNGKHDITAFELQKVFKLRGQADLIVPFHTNSYERPLFRRVVSRTYTLLLNLLFGYRFHYYNDSTLYRRTQLTSLMLRTSSYAVTAEALIKSKRSGCSHIEVPTRNLYPPRTPTKAFRLGNVVGVVRFLGAIIYDVYFGRNYSRG